MDKATITDRTIVPNEALSLPSSIIGTNESRQLPAVDEQQARTRLESAIDDWLGATTHPRECARIKGLLAFALVGNELHLKQKNGLSPQQLIDMPDTVWKALNQLALSYGSEIRSVFFSRELYSLPAGVWTIPALDYLEAPDFRGKRINLRACAPGQTLRVNLRGTQGAPSVHLREKAGVEFVDCPVRLTAYFYDDENLVSSTQSMGPFPLPSNDIDSAKVHLLPLASPALPPGTAVPPLPGKTSASAAGALKAVEIAPVPGQAIAKVAAPGPHAATLGKNLRAAFAEGDAEKVFSATEAILMLKIPAEAKFNLLTARQPDWNPGLVLAFSKGHVEVIRKYADLILASTLSDTEKVGLLRAKSTTAVDGLTYALEANQTAAIHAFATLVLASMLSISHKVELLEADNPVDGPLLRAALGDGRRDAVQTFCKCILDASPWLPLEQTVRLLRVQSKGQINSGLALAMERKQHLAVSDFTELVLESRLPTEIKFQLVQKKENTGEIRSFNDAVKAGHYDAVGEYMKTIFASALSNPDKLSLIQISDGLLGTISSYRSETVTTFCKNIICSNFSNTQKVQLIRKGMGFSSVLLEGQFTTISTFLTVILESTFSSEAKIELIEAKETSEQPGFVQLLRTDIGLGCSGALIAKYSRSIKTFVSLIAASNFSDSEKLRLLLGTQFEKSKSFKIFGNNIVMETFRSAVQATSLPAILVQKLLSKN